MNTESNEPGPCKTSLWPWANRKDKAQPMVKPKGRTVTFSGREGRGGTFPQSRKNHCGEGQSGAGGLGSGRRMGSAHKFGQRVQGLFLSQPPFLRASPSLSIGTSQQSHISKKQAERCTEIQQVGREEVDCRPRPNSGPSASTTPACQRAESTWTKGTLEL